MTISGVVYNEMKGAFSSPEGVLDRVVLNSLFPDNAYSVESGGDPEVIPELTYEQFLDFHRSIIIHLTAIFTCMVTWIWKKN